MSESTRQLLLYLPQEKSSFNRNSPSGSQNSKCFKLSQEIDFNFESAYKQLTKREDDHQFIQNRATKMKNAQKQKQKQEQKIPQNPKLVAQNKSLVLPSSQTTKPQMFRRQSTSSVNYVQFSKIREENHLEELAEKLQNIQLLLPDSEELAQRKFGPQTMKTKCPGLKFNELTKEIGNSKEQKKTEAQTIRIPYSSKQVTASNQFQKQNSFNTKNNNSETSRKSQIKSILSVQKELSPQFRKKRNSVAFDTSKISLLDSTIEDFSIPDFQNKSCKNDNIQKKASKFASSKPQIRQPNKIRERISEITTKTSQKVNKSIPINKKFNIRETSKSQTRKTLNKSVIQNEKPQDATKVIKALIKQKEKTKIQQNNQQSTKLKNLLNQKVEHIPTNVQNKNISRKNSLDEFLELEKQLQETFNNNAINIYNQNNFNQPNQINNNITDNIHFLSDLEEDVPEER